MQITTDKPKYPSYEIDNLKADIQYAQQLIAVNRAKSNLYSKQFELNKILNTGNDAVMYDTKESTLLGHWAFLEIKLPDYDFLENVALQYSYMVKISEKNIEKAQEEVTLAKRQRVPDVSVAGGYAWQAHRNAPNDFGGAFVGGTIDVPVLYNFTPEIQKAQIYLERSKASKKAYEYQLKYELKKDYIILQDIIKNMNIPISIKEFMKVITRDNYILLVIDPHHEITSDLKKYFKKY